MSNSNIPAVPAQVSPDEAKNWGLHYLASTLGVEPLAIAKQSDGHQHSPENAASKVFLAESSSQATPVTNWFADALAVLSVGDYLLVFGHFEHQEKDMPLATYPFLPQVHSQAERMGFAVVAEQSWVGSQPKLEVAAVIFQLKTQPRWIISTLDDRNRLAVRSLFHEVFGHELSEAMWEWKYGAGRGRAIGAWRDGKLVAHYASIPVRVQFFGREMSACQIVDVMVKKGERGVMTTRGALYSCVATFFENWVGYGKVSDITFGFPSERHFLIGKFKKQYAEVNHIAQISWVPQLRKLSMMFKVHSLSQEAKVFKKTVNDLWRIMKTDMNESVIGIRDAKHILHRYCQHPEKNYTLYTLRSRLLRKPLALIVMRVDAGRLEWLDYVGALRHIPLAVRYVRSIAAELGANEVYCWITKNFVNSFLSEECTVTETDIVIPANDWTEGIPPETLRDRWWLMSGDTDFR